MAIKTENTSASRAADADSVGNELRKAVLPVRIDQNSAPQLTLKQRIQAEGMPIDGLFITAPSTYMTSAVKLPEADGVQIVDQTTTLGASSYRMPPTRIGICEVMKCKSSVPMYWTATYGVANGGTKDLVSEMQIRPENIVRPKEFMAISAQGIERPTATSIGTLNSLVGGASYVNGTYANVYLTGGNGSGARATVVVSGAAVTAVTITTNGLGYRVGDVLSAANTAIGGAGAGFSINVATINSNKVTATSSIGGGFKASADMNYSAKYRMAIFANSNTEGTAMAVTVSTFGSLVGGSGYVNGTYSNVPLTGGYGSGLTATIMVSGGVVTSVTTPNSALGYHAGNVLSASNASLGGSGSGFTITIASVTSNVYASGVSMHDVWTWQVRKWYRSRGYDVRLIDKSVSGKSSIDFDGYRETGMLDLPDAPHIVFYALGTNDTDSVRYGINVRKFRDWALTEWPNALLVICGPPPRQTFVSTMAVIKAEGEAAAAEVNMPDQVTHVDLWPAFDYTDDRYYSGTEASGSHVHLKGPGNFSGQAAVANLITSIFSTTKQSFGNLKFS